MAITFNNLFFPDVFIWLEMFLERLGDANIPKLWQQLLDWSQRRRAPEINFTNFLRAAFEPISFCQKITNLNCKNREAAQNTFVQKMMPIKCWSNWHQLFSVFPKNLHGGKPFHCSNIWGQFCSLLVKWWWNWSLVSRYAWIFIVLVEQP